MLRKQSHKKMSSEKKNTLQGRNAALQVCIQQEAKKRDSDV
jgi:hypothetical protein